MFVIGYGTNMDVTNLSFAVLDHDDTAISRDYVLQLAGSRYFTEKAPITDYADMDRRMEDGELSLAIEIPPGFGRDLARGSDVAIGAWIDGAMPARAETVQGYVQGMHASWLAQKARQLYGDAALAGDFQLEIRYRYNPDVQSLVAMVPAVIPLVLMMIPAMLAVLSVVREKELGLHRQFLRHAGDAAGVPARQADSLRVLAMLNFVLLLAFALFVFRVPFTGSMATFSLAALLYVVVATARAW